MGHAQLVIPEGGAAVVPDPASMSETDPQARLRAIFSEHYDFIWRSLRRLGLDTGGADDGAQQVFLVAARKLDEIRAGGERPYLFGIAMRVASDARRSTARRREHLVDEMGDTVDPAPYVDEMIDRGRARLLLDEMLEQLPMTLRVVFTLHELEEMSMADIAQLLEIPPGTVASRLRRARQTFEANVGRLRRGLPPLAARPGAHPEPGEDR